MDRINYNKEREKKKIKKEKEFKGTPNLRL